MDAYYIQNAFCEKSTWYHEMVDAINKYQLQISKNIKNTSMEKKNSIENR